MTEFLVGTSAAIRALREDIDLAAQSNATVLISGEDGCGKEQLARLIHERGGRPRSSFKTIRCTDAEDPLRGAAALGGTIFLDEIGEMSLTTQAQLLDFLERSRMRHRAHPGRAPIDVRIIAATRHRLSERIRDQAFRPDLYYRVNVMHLRVPPLRDRQGDIPVLISRFFHSLSETHQRPVPDLDARAEAALLEYGWPGNVTELRAITERLMLAPHASCIHLDDLPQEIAGLSSLTPTGSGWQPASPLEPGTRAASKNVSAVTSTLC